MVLFLKVNGVILALCLADRTFLFVRSIHYLKRAKALFCWTEGEVLASFLLTRLFLHSVHHMSLSLAILQVSA